jgi:hypothetical protein
MVLAHPTHITPTPMRTQLSASILRTPIGLILQLYLILFCRFILHTLVRHPPVSLDTPCSILQLDSYSCELIPHTPIWHPPVSFDEPSPHKWWLRLGQRERRRGEEEVVLTHTHDLLNAGGLQGQTRLIHKNQRGTEMFGQAGIAREALQSSCFTNQTVRTPCLYSNVNAKLHLGIRHSGHSIHVFTPMQSFCRQ